MKPFTILCFGLLFFTSSLSFAQVAETSKTKATVYIFSASFTDLIARVQYFIGDQYIGKCHGNKYIKLMLDPGEYLIWAIAGNHSFIEAHVQSGKTYVIKAFGRLSALQANVDLQGINYEKRKTLNKIKKRFHKYEELQYDPIKRRKEQRRLSSSIKFGMKKYKKRLNKKRVSKLVDAVQLNDFMPIRE